MASFWGSTASKAGTFALGTAEGAVKGGVVGLIGGGAVGGLLGGAIGGSAAAILGSVLAFVTWGALSPITLPLTILGATAGVVWGGGIGASFLAPLAAAVKGIFGGAKRLGQANAIDEQNKVTELSEAQGLRANAEAELKQTIAEANAKKAAFSSFNNVDATDGHGQKVLDEKKLTPSQFLGAGGRS